MARELATTRRVRKGPLPTVGATPATTANVPDATETPGSVATGPASPEIRDRVVADVRHEIGNYFHKLYYWTDFLSDSRSGRGGDVTATQMLEETIRGLEELLRAALEYVRPIAAMPIRMGAREVLEGIVKHLGTGLDGRRIVVADGLDLDAAAVLVDPGRLSHALGFLAQRLVASTAAGATLRVAVDATRSARGGTLAVRITTPCAVPGGRPTVAEVEWATAENIIHVLGGELSACDDGAGETTIALVLPLHV